MGIIIVVINIICVMFVIHQYINNSKTFMGYINNNIAIFLMTLFIKLF